jgi:hypothetical protein
MITNNHTRSDHPFLSIVSGTKQRTLNTPNMRLFLVFCNLLLFISALNGQAKYDNNWLFGYSYTQMLSDRFGVSILILQIPSRFLTQSNAYIRGSNTMISDSMGQLQFYSDGCAIYNWQHQVMENGEQINYPGWGYQQTCVPETGYTSRPPKHAHPPLAR